MEMNNLFVEAIKNKVRFNYRGQISTEDLYDLPVTALDTIFKGLNSELKQVKEESLLDTKTKEDKLLDMKIEIVKHIVKEKLEAENEKLQERAKKEQKQKIMEILSTKQDETLQGKSVEELKAMLDELN